MSIKEKPPQPLRECPFCSGVPNYSVVYSHCNYNHKGEGGEMKPRRTETITCNNVKKCIVRPRLTRIESGDACEIWNSKIGKRDMEDKNLELLRNLLKWYYIEYREETDKFEPIKQWVDGDSHNRTLTDQEFDRLKSRNIETAYESIDGGGGVVNYYQLVVMIDDKDYYAIDWTKDSWEGSCFSGEWKKVEKKTKTVEYYE